MYSTTLRRRTTSHGFAHIALLTPLARAPPTDNLRWAVIGSTKRWGNWQTHEARLLQRTGTYEWALPLSRKDFEEGVSYKYVLIDTTRPDTVIWEQGGNRELIGMPYPEKASAIRQDEMPQIDMPLWHGAGCVIPVFSLRSQTSSGIGDFGDLCKFVHWAAEVGMRAVQLLPINDTTRTGSWHDSYPYNGISVFALHPIYLDMREWSSSQAYATYQHEGEELNLLPQIDYERVFQLKTKFARALFKENGKRTIASAAFKSSITITSSGSQRILPFVPYATFTTRLTSVPGQPMHPRPTRLNNLSTLTHNWKRRAPIMPTFNFCSIAKCSKRTMKHAN